ncbi:MAG: hypothetical protein SFU87_03555 [Chitinophagaceae bacterium]|nr:hypothetical protein [Chitinophagaceae bacterium]
MRRKSYLRIAVLVMVAVVSLAWFSYQKNTDGAVPAGEIPCSEKCSEQDEKKSRSGIPVLESLSRHLMSLNK